MGLNCTGMLVSRYLSIVNTMALHGPWLVESIDVGKLGPIVSYILRLTPRLSISQVEQIH